MTAYPSTRTRAPDDVTFSVRAPVSSRGAETEPTAPRRPAKPEQKRPAKQTARQDRAHASARRNQGRGRGRRS